MALSLEEKRARRVALAYAVKTLRMYLGVSQAELAFKIGDDPGTISRWERKILTPSPSKRKILADLARRHGWCDLAVAFVNPIEEWRSLFLDEANHDRLLLCEIIMINRPDYRDRDKVIPQNQYRQFQAVLEKIEDTLRKAHARGKEITIFGPYQAAAWSRIIGTDPEADPGEGLESLKARFQERRANREAADAADAQGRRGEIAAPGCQPPATAR